MRNKPAVACRSLALTIFWPEELLTAPGAGFAVGFTGEATLLKRMAGTTRLELATSAVTGQRSNQLNYVPALGTNSAQELPSGSASEQVASTTGGIRWAISMLNGDQIGVKSPPAGAGGFCQEPTAGPSILAALDFYTGQWLRYHLFVPGLTVSTNCFMMSCSQSLYARLSK